MVGERGGVGKRGKVGLLRAVWGHDRDKGCCQNAHISPVLRQPETILGRGDRE